MLRAARTHADIGVAAERAFFHVAIADAGKEHDLAEGGEIGVGLFGGADVRLGNDFAERRATAVVIDIGLFGGVREAFVKIFRGIFFQVKTGDADALFGATDFNFQPAVGSERQFVLRDLIALGEVRVEVVFPGKTRAFLNRAIQGERGAHGHFHSALVQYGESSRQAEAHWADVGIRRVAKAGGAAAEDFRLGQELDVDFQTDDRLIFRLQFRRHSRGF